MLVRLPTVFENCWREQHRAAVADIRNLFWQISRAIWHQRLFTLSPENRTPFAAKRSNAFGDVGFRSGSDGQPQSSRRCSKRPLRLFHLREFHPARLKKKAFFSG